LEWLNEAILASDRDRFCTVLYSTLERVDAERWRYTSVAGGHPLPLLVRPGEDARSLGAAGTLLGVLPSVRLTPNVVELTTGDTLVLNTDGITDVPAPFGLDEAGMRALVTEAAHSAGHAERVAEHLGVAVQRRLSIPERDDDIALVVLRFTGDVEVESDDPAVDPNDAVVVAERGFDQASGSVSAAREFVVETVGNPALDDALRLAVSELATNAVIHARSSFRIRVIRLGTAVRVEVYDRSERLPIRNHQRHDAISGRGIGIVEHVSNRWGVMPTDGGKAIWFEIQP
jgi:hypothetical protein